MCLPPKQQRMKNGIDFIHSDFKIRVTVIADNTEQEVSTYSNKVAENATYSGKQHANTFTRFHAVSPKGKIYLAGESFHGCMNDQQTSNLIKVENMIDSDEGYMVDRGYNGIKGPNILRKKSGRLSEEDKEWNRQIDKIRVVVENQFKYLKNWHILRDTFRMKLTKNSGLNELKDIHNQYWHIACALTNKFAPPLRDYEQIM